MQYDNDRIMKQSAGSATYSRADALGVPMTRLADHRTDPGMGPIGSAAVQANIMLGVLCELYERSIHTLRDASTRCYVLP
jgi:hypothetical protein